MLEDHRTRNRAVHPPNLDIPADEHENDSNPNESVIDDAEDESSTRRARRFSKTPRDAEPKSTTLKYYPPCWQAVLEIAKSNMKKHVALVNSFPRRDRDLKEATLILRNTIAEYERTEGNSLAPGFFFVFLTYELLIICFRILPRSRYEHSGKILLFHHSTSTNFLPRFSMNIRSFARN